LEISNPPVEPEKIARSFPGRYESLAQIGDFIRGVAHKAGLGNFASYTVEMAVDEACSNIIEHAYGGENLGQIKCICKINNEGLTIILEDDGRPFDPEIIDEPKVSGALEDRPAHGLGVYFIRQWMDRVEYVSRIDNRNRLTLFKQRPISLKNKSRKKP
jgi:serine/threonine-protein kinase RsbW